MSVRERRFESTASLMVRSGCKQTVPWAITDGSPVRSFFEAPRALTSETVCQFD